MVCSEDQEEYLAPRLLLAYGGEVHLSDAARAAAKQLKGLDADAALPAPLPTPLDELKAAAKEAKASKAKASKAAYLQSSAEDRSRLLSSASAHAPPARLNEARAVQHAAMQASTSNAPGATAAAGNEARMAYLATGDAGIAAQAV